MGENLQFTVMGFTIFGVVENLADLGRILSLGNSVHHLKLTFLNTSWEAAEGTAVEPSDMQWEGQYSSRSIAAGVEWRGGNTPETPERAGEEYRTKKKK